MFSPGEKLENATRQMEKRRNLRLESARGGFLIHTKNPATGEDIVCTKDNATPEILRYARTLGHIPDDEMLAAYLTVISERGERELKTDKLTDIANLASYNETVEKAAEEVENSEFEAVVVIALDLNKFKDINDKYNHGVGDKALQAFANRLKAGIRTNEYPFRKGGDEFAMVLKMKGKEDSTDEAIKKTFENIQRRINENLFIKASKEGQEENIQIESAMGYSIKRKGDNKNAEQLFQEADEMAIKAKGYKKT